LCIGDETHTHTHTHTHTTHTQAQIMEKNKCTLINTLECAFTFVFPNFA